MISMFFIKKNVHHYFEDVFFVFFLDLSLKIYNFLFVVIVFVCFVFVFLECFFT